MRRYAQFLALLTLAISLTATSGRPDQESEPPRDDKAQDWVIERQETLYRFENDGTGQWIQSGRLRVLTEAGRNAVGQFQVTYSSQREDVRFDYYRTVKRDGRRIEADTQQALDMLSPVTRDAPTFSDLKTKVMVTPNLEVGDALEYQFTYTYHTPLKPGDFWTVYYPSRQVVTESETVTLDVPADRALTLKSDSQVQCKIEERVGRRTYAWTFSNRKPAEAEAESGPLFAVSTLNSWEQVGQWYLELHKDRAVPTPEVRELAAKLTATKTSPREKLEAIYNYVSQSVRYVSIAFGIGGLQAHRSSEVLRNGYGDCKDKHVLLMALLRAVGLEAHAALIDTSREKIELAVPIPTLFNHVVSMVPLGGNQVWLDTTLGVAPLGWLPRYMRGKSALLIQPGRTEIVEVPSRSAVAEFARLNMTGKLDSTGKLTLDNRYVLRGSWEVYYRGLFRLDNKQLTDSLIKGLASKQVSDAEVKEQRMSDPTDSSKPFELYYQLTRAEFYGLMEKKVEAAIPSVLVSSGLPACPPDKAADEKTTKEPGAAPKKDIELDGPAEFDETLDLNLDPGFQVELPIPVHVERSFAGYESSYSLVGGRLRVHRLLRLKEEKLAPERRAELVSFRNLVVGDLDQKLTIQRKEPVDTAAIAEALTADQLNHAGVRALHERNFALARDLLERATIKDANHKQAWNNLGHAYMELGDLDKAEKAVERQIEISPYDEYAYTTLGFIRRRQGKYEQAIESFEGQLKINPLDKRTYPALAEAYGAAGRWDDAAHAYEKAIGIEKQKRGLEALAGRAYLKAGKPDEAMKWFSRELESAQHPGSYGIVAWALADAGVELDKAKAYAQTAVEQTAGVLQAVSSLSAPEQYPNLLGSFGNMLDTFGWICVQQHEEAKAEEWLRSSFSLLPTPAVAEHLAVLYARLGKAEEAFRYYAFARRRKPKSEPLAAEALEFLHKHFGSADALAQRVKALDESGLVIRTVPAPTGGFAWPSQVDGKKLEKSVRVKLRVLVGEDGKVVDAKALDGGEPYRTVALGDARRLQLPAAAWPGGKIKTVRLVEFSYMPFGNVGATWSYGTERFVEPEWMPPPAGLPAM